MELYSLDEMIMKDFTFLNAQEFNDAQVCDQNPNGKRQVLIMEYKGDKPSICPRCGGTLYSHGCRTITVTDTPFLGVPTKLDLRVPRRHCQNKDCGYTWIPDLEGVDEKRKMTTRTCLKMANLSLKRSFRDISGEYGVAYNTVKNTFIDFINEKEKNIHFVTPAFLGLDEIKIKKLGEVTVVTDLEHRTLYDMMLGRNQTSLTEYFSRIPNPENVLWVCTDMYRPFEKTIKSALPNARWVVDHFHIVAYANRAMDTVRIAVQSKLSKKQRIATKKGLAYTLRTRVSKMTMEEGAQIKACRQRPEMKDLMTAFDLKEDFFNIYDLNMKSKENAQKAFAEWEKSIPAAPIFEPFRDLAATVHNFYEEIFNFWDCPLSITNGFTECTNRIIRENNVKGRGNSFDILRARTLYRNANLERAESIGMLLGPAVMRKGPLFQFEDLDERDQEIQPEPFNSFDYDPLIGLIPGVNYDPDTGEIFEDFFDDEEEEENP